MDALLLGLAIGLAAGVTPGPALGPLTIATWRDEPANAVALLVGFHVTLVGAKVVPAL